MTRQTTAPEGLGWRRSSILILVVFASLGYLSHCWDTWNELYQRGLKDVETTCEAPRFFDGVRCQANDAPVDRWVTHQIAEVGEDGTLRFDGLTSAGIYRIMFQDGESAEMLEILPGGQQKYIAYGSTIAPRSKIFGLLEEGECVWDKRSATGMFCPKSQRWARIKGGMSR